MSGADQKGIHVGRRDFLKTMTLAGMAATLPGAALADQSSAGAIRPRPAGGKNNLLCLSDNPPAHEKFIESIQSKLFALPDDTVVLPGHGAATAIGTERPQLPTWIERGW